MANDDTRSIITHKLFAFCFRWVVIKLEFRTCSLLATNHKHNFFYVLLTLKWWYGQTTHKMSDTCWCEIYAAEWIFDGKRVLLSSRWIPDWVTVTYLTEVQVVDGLDSKFYAFSSEMNNVDMGKQWILFLNTKSKTATKDNYEWHIWHISISFHIIHFHILLLRVSLIFHLSVLLWQPESWWNAKQVNAAVKRKLY